MQSHNDMTILRDNHPPFRQSVGARSHIDPSAFRFTWLGGPVTAVAAGQLHTWAVKTDGTWFASPAVIRFPTEGVFRSVWGWGRVCG